MRGLYAITPETRDTARLIEQVRLAIAGGATVVQYRSKRIGQNVVRQQAEALRAITLETGTKFVVNDNIELALSVGADGVHLGRDDADTDTVAKLRKQCAPRLSAAPFIIGVSCYNELSLAETAVEVGADYVAFGSFFPSPTKPTATKADVALIRMAKAKFDVPVVAIGGITVDNAQELISANVDMVAVISSLFGADDIEHRAREFTNLFKSGIHVH